MVIRQNLPVADARTTPSRTLTLEDLRALVEVSAGLDGALIVRVQAIPFHMPDLGNPLGGRAMVLALDTEADHSHEGVAMNRAERRARGQRGRKFADGSD
jgi:hypothetical protein